MPLARRSGRNYLCGDRAEWEAIAFASIHMARAGTVADNL